MQFEDTKQALIMLADLVLCYSLTESMDIIVYADEQRMSRSDCTDVPTHLNLPCLLMTKGPFSHVTHCLHHRIYRDEERHGSESMLIHNASLTLGLLSITKTREKLELCYWIFINPL